MRCIDKYEIYNDDEIVDDEGGNSDDVVELEEDFSIEDVLVVVYEEGKKKDGDGVMIKFELMYEEIWIFEKDGINLFDDCICIKWYGKGLKKWFENIKVKVKIRGVVNCYIVFVKQEVFVEDVLEVLMGDDIF